MKKTKIIAIAVLCIFVASIAFAQDRTRGASARAQERASDQAIFHRVTDWFATVGKSDVEKQKILDRINRIGIRKIQIKR